MMPAGRLQQAIRLADGIVGGVACAAAAVMIVIVTAEVVARYVFASSIFFANELARLMFIWVIFLGIPLALSRGRHVGIELFASHLPKAAARLLFRVVCALSAVLMAVVMVESAQTMAFNWVQSLQTLPLSASWFFVPIPIGSGLSIAYLAIMIATGERVLIRDNALAEQ